MQMLMAVMMVMVWANIGAAEESAHAQQLTAEDWEIIRNLELLEMLEEVEDLEGWENYEVVEKMEAKDEHSK